MPDLHHNLSQTTRGRALLLLRSGLRTVNELAAALGVTDNAVRTHLASLQRDGLVAQAGLEPAVRRPNQVYELTPAAEQLFPKPYDQVLSTLLDVLKDKLAPAARRRALEEVGRRLAQPYKPQVTDGKLRQRVQTAVRILNELGGIAELAENRGSFAIRSRGCPLAQVVRGHPETCAAVEAMLSELLGVPVHEHCHRGDRPHCEFEIKS